MAQKSGHFKHRGRPGKRGGSAPSISTVELVEKTTMDKERSVQVAKEVTAQERQCYRNAFFAVVTNDDLYYVEGFAALGNTLVPHAWLETEEGIVVEPTPYWLTDSARYFAAVRYTARQARSFMSALPIAITRNREEYIRAKIFAYKVVYGEQAAALVERTFMDNLA